jgi:general secretion pathway protein G
VSSTRRTAFALGVLTGAFLTFVLMVLLLMSALPNQRAARTRLDIGNLEHALNLFQARTGAYPEPASGFGALVDQGIIDRIPKDGWGNDYRYALVDGRPVITSLGSDGQLGGEGDAADLSNAPPRVTRR